MSIISLRTAFRSTLAALASAGSTVNDIVAMPTAVRGTAVRACCVCVHVRVRGEVVELAEQIYERAGPLLNLSQGGYETRSARTFVLKVRMIALTNALKAIFRLYLV